MYRCRARITCAGSRPQWRAPRIRDRRSNSTSLALAEVLLLGVPVKQDHQAERSPPPPPVASNDNRTTSPHPHPPRRVRRGPVRLHPSQVLAPLAPSLTPFPAALRI